MLELFAVFVAFMILPFSAYSNVYRNQSEFVEPFSFPERKVEEDFVLNETSGYYDLEITIGDDITWVKTDQTYFENNLKDFVKLPLTIKNIGRTANNLLSPRYYGPSGNLLCNVNDLSFYDANDMFALVPPGETFETWFYMEYDGDGEYTVELSFGFGDAYELKTYITK